ncbi:ABC transporter permease [Couchioplanes azureus]|uniref:ABC transporter permease n=1 Tax=Couchioplanes caeruleus TaxID=56438 RepID=UPI0016711A24|nr:ABC transporter permease [Couchioplanes caeruleus]GGQ44079.1 ABC transporter permease [Couchioplanes caeruleus subsp. azureus]
MKATTTARSAYPPNVDDLLPRAVELTRQLGEVPSRNKLMKTFRVGADKAKALREALDRLAEQDKFRSDMHLHLVSRGSLAEAPPLHLAPTPPADPDDGEVPDDTAPVLPPASEDAKPEATSKPLTSPQSPSDERPAGRPVTWPVLILCLPAFVAIWGGWVEMGRLTGFGKVTLLPGISTFQLDTAITLPIGVETYAAFALFVWLSGRARGDAREFAKWSALGSLALGALGQIAYHLMAAAGWSSAPWPITAAVSCIPVAVLGMGAALAHLMHRPSTRTETSR